LRKVSSYEEDFTVSNNGKIGYKMKHERNVLHETEISDYHQPSYTASMTRHRMYKTEYLHL